MTDLGDDVLGDALREAASHFDPPAHGMERILAAAGRPSRTAGARSVRAARSRMVLSAAAVAVVAVAVTLGAVSLSHVPTARTRGVVLAPPSTTLPGSSALPGEPLSLSGAAYDSAQAAGGLSLTAARPQTERASRSLAAKVVAVGTVELTVERSGMQAAVEHLTRLTVLDSGFVASSTVHVGTDAASRSSATVVLRVPVARFSTLLGQVQHVGSVRSVKTTSTDVTGQYVDLQARIRALDASRQQYLTIMQRATSISDILAIQAQVDQIQTQIEQLEGQRNVLANEAAYSTLTVSLTPAGQAPLGQAPSGSGVAAAWHASVRGFVLGVEWLIRAAGPALFALLCLLALLVLGRVAWRASQRRLL